MSADQRLVATSAPRRRVPAALAIGALGLGLLATPSGLAIAKPATPTQATAASRQAPDSLFPEQGSSKYDVKHYAISLGFESAGDIKAKTTLTAKARKPLRSFSLDLEGLTSGSTRDSRLMPSGCGMPLMADPARPRHSRRSTTATQQTIPCGRPRPRISMIQLTCSVHRAISEAL